MEQTEPTFTNQQIVMMMTHIIDIKYSQFEKDFLPHIDSLDHFHRTLFIYRNNRGYTWGQAADLARRI